MLRLEGFGVDFAWILIRNLAPGGGSAKTALDVFCALGAALGGRWPQDAPRALQRQILDRFGTIFGRFLMLLPPFLFALKREVNVEFGLLCLSKG